MPPHSPSTEMHTPRFSNINFGLPFQIQLLGQPWLPVLTPSSLLSFHILVGFDRFQ